MTAYGFSREDAKRIADTVRKSESTATNSLPPSSRSTESQYFSVKAILKEDIAYGESGTVELYRGKTKDAQQASGKEVQAHNEIIGLKADTVVKMAFFGGGWEIISVDLTSVDEYDATIKQAFGHDENGDAIWLDADGDCDA